MLNGMLILSYVNGILQWIMTVLVIVACIKYIKQK